MRPLQRRNVFTSLREDKYFLSKIYLRKEGRLILRRETGGLRIKTRRSLKGGTQHNCPLPCSLSGDCENPADKDKKKKEDYHENPKLGHQRARESLVSLTKKPL